jgi:tRNA(Ile)-lysidine synthase
MRQDTPGLGRLRDWSPSPVWPEGRDIFLLRPLLAYRRAALRAWLTGHGWTWLEDPGNADPRFARSRARRALAVQPRPDSGSPSLETDGADAQHLAEAFAISADARISFDPRLIRNAASKASHRALSAALVCAGGGERPPRGEALDRLMALIHASGPHGVTSTATLAGTRVRWRYDGVEMGREAGRASISPLSLAAGEGGVFDGRYFVEAEAAVTVVALAGRMAGLSRSDRARTRSAPAYARGVLPALLDLNGDVRLPRPFGDGPARVQPLVGRRFAAALGLIATEAQLERGLDMAPDHVSSYVLSQKLVF